MIHVHIHEAYFYYMLFFKRVNLFPVVLHVYYQPMVFGCIIQSFFQVAYGAFAVVGLLPD